METAWLPMQLYRRSPPACILCHYELILVGMILCGLPIPPSVNNSYPTNKFGRRFKSEGLKNWEKLLDYWAFQHAEQVSLARKEFAKPKAGQVVYIHTDFLFHKTSILTLKGWPKRNDTSNRLKHIHDGISRLIWLDDCYFWHGGFSKQVVSTTQAEVCDVGLHWLPIEETVPKLDLN